MLPSFNNIAGKSIGPDYLFTPLILISLLVVVLVTGLLSGSYPAFLNIGKSNLNIRKILVVAQFTLSLTTQEMVDKLPVLKQNLKANPNIIQVGMANAAIGQGRGKTIMRVETPEGMVERGINFFRVDHDFIDAAGIKLAEGRGFSEEFLGDTATGVIINSDCTMYWRARCSCITRNVIQFL